MGMQSYSYLLANKHNVDRLVYYEVYTEIIYAFLEKKN